MAHRINTFGIRRSALALVVFATSLFAQTPKENLQRVVGTNTIGGTLAAAPFKVETIAAMKAVVVASRFNGQQVEVANYAAANDGGGGTFYFNSASSAGDDGGTVVAPTVGSGRWIRVFTGPVHFAWFSPPGDGATDCRSKLVAAAAAALAAPSRTLTLPPGTFYATGTLNVSGITIIGAGTILKGDGTGTFLSSSGTVGTFQNLGSNANAGATSVVCAGLASSVVEGDLIKVVSNADFVSADPGRLQGELAVVRSVSGSTITLSGPLFDTYTTASAARAARIAPSSFSCRGINIVLADGASGIGISVKYSVAPAVEATLLNCQYTGVLVLDCWAPRIECVVNDSFDNSNSTSYGASIGNATMFATVRGVYYHCRHAITTSGNSDGGVVWEALIDGVAGSGASTGSQPVFNAHASTGSVKFRDCSANGPSTADGFGLYARTAIIQNCRVVRCATGVNYGLALSDSTLRIDGLDCTDTPYGVILTGSIYNLYVSRLTGNFSLRAIDLSTNSAVLGAWSFDRVEVIDGVGSIILTSATLGTMPTTIQFTNCAVKTTNYATAGVAFNFQHNSGPLNVRLVNFSSYKANRVLASAETLASLDLINCTADQYETYAVTLQKGCTQMVTIQGGEFKPATANSYVIYSVSAAVQFRCAMIGVKATDSNLFRIMRSGYAGSKYFVSGCDFAVTTTNVNNSDGPLIVGGTIDNPTDFIGSGTPESSVSANIGSTYRRTNGGASTAFYVKESGTGNTGWVGK